MDSLNKVISDLETYKSNFSKEYGGFPGMEIRGLIIFLDNVAGRLNNLNIEKNEHPQSHINLFMKPQQSSVNTNS